MDIDIHNTCVRTSYKHLAIEKQPHTSLRIRRFEKSC